jgi:hypothetical protein
VPQQIGAFRVQGLGPIEAWRRVTDLHHSQIVGKDERIRLGAYFHQLRVQLVNVSADVTENRDPTRTRSGHVEVPVMPAGSVELYSTISR